MAILDVKNISAGYGDVQILWDVSLELEKGKLTALVGANGAGKTTLLRTIVGLIRPQQGSVNFNNDNVTRLKPHQKAELGIILVPEGRQLFTSMTVEENLIMGVTPKRARSHMEENLDKVYSLFPRLQERSKQGAGTLSGGEQQMLAVARGIMADPDVLMFDELSLGLAPNLVLDLFDDLIKLKKLGMTLLLVEQNVQMALAVSDFGFVLAQGRIEMQGESRELAKKEHIRQAYLGL
jgi:branched-chain amino acid transport system ATP-binding protein